MDQPAVWESISEEFRSHVGEGAWRTWFITISPQVISADEVVLTTPSPLAKERLETRYREVLAGMFERAFGHAVPVKVKVRSETRPQDSPQPDPYPTRSQLRLASDKFQSQAANPNSLLSSPMDPRYTFDAFVIGSSNRFAHAASLSVAETPANSYNPLFIHGDAGLGKTHLLHAIGNYVRENYPERYVKYVSTETFLNEFVDAIKTNRTSEFKTRYRQCDVLLVDDIQFLENKEAIQEEFFHTFNFLYNGHAQIVLTSDRPPRSLATLEDRLKSRFAMGLITDIQTPDLETRSAILKRKSEDAHVQFPEEVIEFIATSITENIRELEGALTRLAAYSSLNRIPISLGLAETVLSDLVSNRPGRLARTPQEVIAATAALFGVQPEEITGNSRKRPIATARQVAMYVMRELTELSYPEIGRAFGGKDHTTVMHAVQKVQLTMNSSIETFEQVDRLFKSLRGPR